MSLVNIHAGGYVGLTAACHYHRAGHRVVITDPDVSVVEAINAGRPKAGSFLHYTELPLVGPEFIAHPEPVLGADVHILAVPSEKNGEPFMDIVHEVFCSLDEKCHPQTPIIVESTLMPGMARELRNVAEFKRASLSPKNVRRPWAIAPRRDWFADKDKNLQTLTRIVGVDPHHFDVISPWITCVSRDVQWTSPETAEITKALENALLHVPVVLLHELALLYPEYDIARAAELASSHWRFQSMGKLYLGLGTGGRCVPLGSRYLNERGGALLGDAIELDDHFAKEALARIIPFDRQRPVYDTAMVLGIGYRPGFKDAGNSPGIRAARAISDGDRFGTYAKHHLVVDPYFSPGEIETLTGPPWRSLPLDFSGLAHADLVVLSVAHPDFADGWRHLAPGATVVDATGMWEDKISEHGGVGVKYIRPGRPGWYREHWKH